jgi:signal transduction histidine kinase
MTTGSSAPIVGHIAIVHEDAERAEALAHVLRKSGHRVTLVPPTRRVVQSILECSPDLVVASLSLVDPNLDTVIRNVRQALGQDPPVLVLVPPEGHGIPLDADEVVREPLDTVEFDMRVARMVHTLFSRRVLERKAQELLGLYKMSWAFSLAGGAEALFGHMARQSAELLRAEKGLVFLFDADRRMMIGQAPGFGLTPEQVSHARYSVDGDARSRWNFRKNGPLMSNKAQADTRLIPDVVQELGLHSVLAAPMTRGPQIMGLLLVADRSRAPFGDEDLNLLLALAAQATVAVENQRLHEEIKRANALLQEYDRLKSEFVGIVAHDFRRPLMAIRGFAELVLEEPDLALETRQEFMRTVISETEHLALLANDTLLITQIETGQFSFRWEEIDLGPFILDAMPLGLSDHSVLLDIPPAFPRIVADPERLRQVLSNLVNNAVKYSPQGGSINVRCRQRGAAHVVIEVIDHGLGIPRDQIGKLFQKFTRVRTDEHMKVSGTGLGLYICRLIVEGHGGQVWVESEVGKGSTFGFVLPLDARAATAERSSREAPEGAPAVRDTGPVLKVPDA